jgi:hypothetical protein
MYDEPLEHSPSELPDPRPELREQVLASCRREIAARRTSEARRRLWWRWSLSTAVAGLLLLNFVEEQRSAGRVAAIVSEGPRVVRSPREVPLAAGSLRARSTLFAALLRDSDAL